MTKVYTVGKSAALKINLTTIVTLRDFSLALGEHKFNLSGDFNFNAMTRKSAKEILFGRLQWHGRNGSYEGLENVGTDHADEYNQYYEEAKEWVSKNYPYLTTTKP